MKALSETPGVIPTDLLTDYISGALEVRQECVRAGVSRSANCTTTRTNRTCSLSLLTCHIRPMQAYPAEVG